MFPHCGLINDLTKLTIPHNLLKLPGFQEKKADRDRFTFATDI